MDWLQCCDALPSTAVTLFAVAGGPEFGSCFLLCIWQLSLRDDLTVREIHSKPDKCFETGLRDAVSSGAETELANGSFLVGSPRGQISLIMQFQIFNSTF